ncbi:hypothetical protein [Caulobacter phage BL199]|nr:hypothetical protein [Caulobacter phage BL199]
MPTDDEDFTELRDYRMDVEFQPQTCDDVLFSHGFDMSTPLDKFMQHDRLQRAYAEAMCSLD